MGVAALPALLSARLANIQRAIAAAFFSVALPTIALAQTADQPTPKPVAPAELADIPSVVLSHATLPESPKVLVLPGH
jgi:hypothetical protein